MSVEMDKDSDIVKAGIVVDETNPVDVSDVQVSMRAVIGEIIEIVRASC